MHRRRATACALEVEERKVLAAKMIDVDNHALGVRRDNFRSGSGWRCRTAWRPWSKPGIHIRLVECRPSARWRRKQRLQTAEELERERTAGRAARRKTGSARRRRSSAWRSEACRHRRGQPQDLRQVLRRRVYAGAAAGAAGSFCRESSLNPARSMPATGQMGQTRSHRPMEF